MSASEAVMSKRAARVHGAADLALAIGVVAGVDDDDDDRAVDGRIRGRAADVDGELVEVLGRGRRDGRCRPPSRRRCRRRSYAVTCLSITSTTMPMPTPAPSVEKSSPPAMFVNDVSSLASREPYRPRAGHRVRVVQEPLGCWLTWRCRSVADLGARRSTKITSTITEPLTAAPPVEAAARDRDRARRPAAFRSPAP